MHRRYKQWCVSARHTAAVAVGGCGAYLGEQQREDPPLPLGRSEREIRDVREQLVKADGGERGEKDECGQVRHAEVVELWRCQLTWRGR